MRRTTPRKVHHAISKTFLAVIIVAASLASGRAQQNHLASSPVKPTSLLPDAPAPSKGLPAQGTSAIQPASTGRIDGTVQDISGGTVAGAKVTLSRVGGDTTRSAVSSQAGEFAFVALPAGSYSISIAVPGMKTLLLPTVNLQAGEHREIPVVSLDIASATTDVQVVATTEEIAQAQIKLEEKQRIVGIIPNFYTSYIWNAAPLTTRQKYSLATHAVLDPTAFIGAGFGAAIEQAQNVFPGYGQGAQGYGKRYGAAFADGAIGQMLSDAVLASALHQDPRYFYRGTGTKKQRVLYALEMVVVQRGDDGHLEPAYSKIIGNFAAGGISNIYKAPSDRDAQTTIDNGLLQFAGRAVDNLVKEFLLKKLTPKLPVYDTGKPDSSTGNTVLNSTAKPTP